MWLIFQIGSQNVYQIRYNGCTGQDVIDDCKEMIAKEYKVSEDNVKVTFNDMVLKTQRIVNSKLWKETKENLKKIENRN